MKLNIALALCVFAASNLPAGQLQAEKPPLTGSIKAIKEYPQGRIAFWEGRVPIYDGYPFYDITLTVAAKSYLVRYESLTGYYPSVWKTGSTIKVRVQHHQPILYNGSEEVPAQIVSGTDCVPSSGPPTVLTTGSQVPC